MTKYPLSYNTWNSEENIAIKKVLSSGFYTMGKETKIFEKNFSKYFKSKHAVMVNSGSSANLLMFAALKLFKKLFKKNVKDPNIIVSPLGWSTSYFPINQNGFKINYVDIDLDSLNIDPDKIEKSVDKNTVAVLAINLLGNPCNFEKISKICKKHKLILLEDNCESMHAKYKSKNAGTFGLMGTHSMFFSHHMQTMEGGVILTNNKYIKDILFSLRAHGWARHLDKKNNLFKLSGDKFKDLNTFILPGYCVRPIEMEAAVGNIQLKKQKKFMRIRKSNAKYFQKLFKDRNWCKIQKIEKNCSSSWFGFSITLTGKLKGKRSSIIKKLIQTKIEVRPLMTGNFLKHPVRKFMNYKVKHKLKNADYIHYNSFVVGNYPRDIKKEIKFLFNILSKEASAKSVKL